MTARVDKIVNYSIINIAFIPAICWSVHYILNRKIARNTSQTTNPPNLIASTYKPSKIFLLVGTISMVGWITLYTTTKPSVQLTKNSASTPNTTKEQAPSIAKYDNNKICRFLWNESTGTFTSLSDDIEDMNNFTNTVIPKSARTEYISSIIPQLREADKTGNEALAREIAKEIRRNSITIFFSSKLSAEFIQTLANSRNIEIQCN